MYNPPAFAAHDRRFLHEFVRRYSFATLLTCGEAPCVSHLPMILDEKVGAEGMLYGHFARPNTHWKMDHQRLSSVAIFHGPHAYVSPTFYPDGALAVPTWNYATVHAVGHLRLVEEIEQAKGIIGRMIAFYESGNTRPWPNPLPTELFEKMMRGIVVFEMPVESIEGKCKLSQNRSIADQRGAIAGLRARGDSEADTLADFAAEYLGHHEGNGTGVRGEDAAGD
jgi:transcriptional regulator